MTNDTLPLDQDGEDKMPYVRCRKCVEYNANKTSGVDYREPNIQVLCRREYATPGPHIPYVSLRGIVTCDFDGHQWPVVLGNNVIDETYSAMPTDESRRMKPSIKEGLRQDIEEAERAHFAGCFKACVTMCRRAMQIALEDKGAVGRTLGPLLENARAKNPPLLAKREDMLAEGIKDFGDGGAHRREEIDPRDAAQVVHVAVSVLNELCD